jgi:hypothetical protein
MMAQRSSITDDSLQHFNFCSSRCNAWALLLVILKGVTTNNIWADRIVIKYAQPPIKLAGTKEEKPTKRTPPTYMVYVTHTTCVKV